MLRRLWHHVNAEEQLLGRMAVRIATRLMGKNRPVYSRGGERATGSFGRRQRIAASRPAADLGDYVVVSNADKVEMKGNRMNTKVYKSHTGYPGGYKETPFKEMVQKHPEDVSSFWTFWIFSGLFG